MFFFWLPETLSLTTPAFIDQQVSTETCNLIVSRPAEKKSLLFLIKAKCFDRDSARGTRALTVFGKSLKGSCKNRSDKYHLILQLRSAINFILSFSPLSFIPSLVKYICISISCLWLLIPFKKVSEPSRHLLEAVHQHIPLKEPLGQGDCLFAFR